MDDTVALIITFRQSPVGENHGEEVRYYWFAGCIS
jgi:hypothetical protein